MRSYSPVGIGAAILAVVGVACGHSEGGAQSVSSSTANGPAVSLARAVSAKSDVTRPQTCVLELQTDRVIFKGGAMSVRFLNGVKPADEFVEGGPTPELDSVAISATMPPIIASASVDTCNAQQPRANIAWVFEQRISTETDVPAARFAQNMETCFSGPTNFPNPNQAQEGEFWHRVSHERANDNSYCVAEFRWRPQPEQIGFHWFAGPEFKPGEDYWFREAVIFRGKMGVDGRLHGYTLRYIVPESDWPYVSETIWSSLKSMEIDWEKFGMPTQPPNRKELRLRKGR